MEIELWVETYRRIAALGLPFMLFLILVGNYYGIWEWGKTCREMLAKQDARIVALDVQRRADIAELKAESTATETRLQARIDQLFNKMMEAAELIEKGARQVARRG
jgi:hypothetical protein